VRVDIDQNLKVNNMKLMDRWEERDRRGVIDEFTSNSWIW